MRTYFRPLVPNKRPTGRPFFIASIPHKVALTPPVVRVLPQIHWLLLSTQHPDEGCEVPVRRAVMCLPTYTALAAQADAQNVTQLAPRSGTGSHKMWMLTSSDFPSRPSSTRGSSTSGPSPVFADNRLRVRASTSGARTNASSFGSFPGTSKSAAGPKTSHMMYV